MIPTEVALRKLAPKEHAKRKQLEAAISRIERAGAEYLKVNTHRIRQWGYRQEQEAANALTGKDND